MNHPEEITKTTPNYIIKWVRQQQAEPLQKKMSTEKHLIHSSSGLKTSKCWKTRVRQKSHSNLLRRIDIYILF